MSMIPSKNSPDVVQAYLNYLKEMSRKISQRKGMENVLYGKTKMTPHYYRSLGNEETEYFRSVTIHLNKNSDRQLFLGNGLLVGSLVKKQSRKYITAPLIYYQVNVESDENDARLYNWIAEEESISINYDLITLLLSQDREDEEGDMIDQSGGIDIKKLEILEDIETKLQSKSSLEPNDKRCPHDWMEDLADEVFHTLKDSITEMAEIQLSSEEFEINSLQKNKIESGLRFYNHQFFYVANSPGELSTYAALQKMIMEVC